jgi:glucosamine--fructose-6-phosphate aminotransferase (isomerizing)
MCGIVGYIGTKPAQGLLIGGLRRLEYRGYDSAGVVTISAKGKPILLRAKGKVAELAALAKANDDHIGIGHTRWATHGEPSTTNAHPHQQGKIFLVHNGIIENYREIKERLQAKGRTFASETDSEVLAGLIDDIYSANHNLRDSVLEALQLVVGAYGIAVVAEDNPQTIIVARKGSPLVVGLGDGESFIASDAAALVGHVDKIIYLNEGEVAEISAGDIQLFDISSTPLTPQVEKLELNLEVVQKNGYDHFLLKEIHEQPESLRATLRGRLNMATNQVVLGGLNLSLAQLRSIRHVLIVACGTASYAGRLGCYLIEQLLDTVTVEVEIGSELRYRSFHVPEHTVALIVSQSGETADTLASLRELKARGVTCLGIVNAVGSTIAREVDGGIYLHVGPEISVASTKAFTSQVAAIVLFALAIAQASGVSQAEMAALVAELAALPGEIEQALKESEPVIKKLAKTFAHKEHAFYLGRNTLYPIAQEGAIKLKEVSYVHAEAYAAGELKHGPISLIDERFFELFLLADNWLFDKSLANLAEVQARGGEVVVVTNSTKDIPAKHTVRLSSKLNQLAPLVMNIPLQLLAYYVAVERGADVDQPRNLAKSVTVE